ncbi:MAG: hypothetical protein WAV13_09560 [Thermodesulfovibrionales bacterium]
MLRAKIRSLLKRIISSPIVLWGKRLMFDEVLVIGDSHANVFYSLKFMPSFPRHFFHVVIVGGATVSGLKNPNSTTRALPIFMDSLRNSKAATTIVLLGEVDAGFVIWYRAEKYKTPVAVMLDQATENYQNLLMEISKKSRVICISTPLPTITDENIWGDIANARKDVKATQRQRTDLTIQFNKQMQEFCDRKRFIYLSFDNECIGENGLVAPWILNSNPNNHHYDRQKYADMIINRLRSIIK